MTGTGEEEWLGQYGPMCIDLVVSDPGGVPEYVFYSIARKEPFVVWNPTMRWKSL